MDGNRGNGREAAAVVLVPKEVETAEKIGGRGSDRVNFPFSGLVPLIFFLFILHMCT